MMRAFCRLIQRNVELTLRTPEFEERIGREAFAALVRSGVIVPGPSAQCYPCGGFQGHGCPRVVMEQPDDPEYPFLAVCGQLPPECASVLLCEADIAQHRVSVPGLVTLLQKLCCIFDKPSQLTGKLSEDAVSLGRREGREVVLALVPLGFGFPHFMSARRVFDMPSRVLVPSRSGLSASLIERYAPGDKVELAFMEDLLSLVDGQLQITRPHVWAPMAVKPFCYLIDHNARRMITEPEYQSVRAAAATYHLFIDRMDTQRHGCAYASSLGIRGEQREVFLRLAEASALSMVITEREVYPHQFNEKHVEDPARPFESGRHKVDVEIRCRVWRAFHTLRDPTRYLFKPPPPELFRFVLLTPETPPESLSLTLR